METDLNADTSRDFAPDAAVTFEQLVAIFVNASGADTSAVCGSALDGFSDGGLGERLGQRLDGLRGRVRPGDAALASEKCDACFAS